VKMSKQPSSSPSRGAEVLFTLVVENSDGDSKGISILAGTSRTLIMQESKVDEIP
jgi:hypothetical protein